MSRRLRLTLLVLGSLALAAVLVLVVAVYLLLQPDRFTAMLQKRARSAGLQLSLANPASPTLFPHPALDLDGITLNADGATTPILLAARGQLTLPWHTLLGGPTTISQLQLDAPRVDLAALQDWLTRLPAQPAGMPPNIPRVDTGISITRGSIVRGDQMLLGNVTLESGHLLSGKPFVLDVSAPPGNAGGNEVRLQLSATPRIQGNTLQLDSIALHLAQGSTMALDLAGSAHWHGAADASASLVGQLHRGDGAPYAVSLTLTPANQVDPLLLALKFDGADNHADLRLPPLALASWWSALNDPLQPQLDVPPGNGSLRIDKLESGGFTVEGLTLQAGDAVPAAVGTVAVPAASPAVKPSAKRKP